MAAEVIGRLLAAAMAAATFQGVGDYPSLPPQFGSTATVQTQIAGFENTLVTKGFVDYSSVSGISNELLNAVADVPKNRPLLGALCFEAKTAAPTPNPCVYVNPKAKDTLVLFGDSHGFEYLNTFVAIAQHRGVRLVTFTRAACGAAQSESTADAAYLPYQTKCNKWRLSVLASLRTMAPNEIVFTQDVNGLPWKLGAIGHFEAAIAHSLTGIVRGHKSTSVVALVDNVSATYGGWGTNSLSTAACLARMHFKSTYIATAATATWHNDSLNCYRVYTNNVFDIPLASREQMVTADHTAGISEIDPRPWMCDLRPKLGLCPPLIGNTLVYRDQGHLTASFTARLVNVMNAVLPVR